MVHWRLTPQQLASLPFNDFIRMSVAYNREEHRRNTNSTTNAAFTAWLLGAGGHDMTFGKFLETYGIIEKSTDSNKVDTKALTEKAERITQQLKKKGLL